MCIFHAEKMSESTAKLLKSAEPLALATPSPTFCEEKLTKKDQPRDQERVADEKVERERVGRRGKGS